MAQQYEIKPPNIFSIIIGLVVLVLIIFGLLNLARFGYRLLSWIAPVLFIATLAINRQVVVNYFLWIKDLFKRQPVWGLGVSLLTLVLHPLVALGLFVRAFLPWRMRKAMKQQQHQQQQQQGQAEIGEYVTFEEVDEPIKTKPKQRLKEGRNDYEQLFEED